MLSKWLSRYNIVTIEMEMDRPMSIKHVLNSAHTMTLIYVISLTLVTCLSIFVYFSLDKSVEQSVFANPVSEMQQQTVGSDQTNQA